MPYGGLRPSHLLSPSDEDNNTPPITCNHHRPPYARCSRGYGFISLKQSCCARVSALSMCRYDHYIPI